MTRGELFHSISRGSFWLALEKVAALVSGMAYVVLLMRWLGPTKYGIITLALVCTGFATTATGNFEMFLERYAAEYEARRLILTLRRAHLLALGIKLALGLVMSVVLLLAVPWLARFFDTPELTVLVPLLTLTVVFDSFSTTGRATLYGIQQFRWLSVLAILFHVAKTVMVGLLWWTRQGLVALAIGFTTITVLLAIGQTVVPLWLTRHAEDHEPPAPEREWRGLFSSMLRYCLPLLGGRITFLSSQNLSKLILGKLFGPTQLGYFTFAWQTVERFVELVHTIPSALLPVFTRLVARQERDRLHAAFDQALRLIQTVGTLLSLAVFVFARELTLFFGSPLFEPAIPVLRVLALVPVARTAQQPLTMLFQSLKRPGTVLVLALVKFVTEFGAYFLLVTTLGIVGAAWANLAGAITSYLAAMVIVGRLLPDGAPERLRTALTAAALPVPLVAATLLIEWRVHGLVLVPIHLALALAAAVAVFALGLARRSDLARLAEVQLESGWTRRLRDLMLAVLGAFARLAGPERVP